MSALWRLAVRSTRATVASSITFTTMTTTTQLLRRPYPRRRERDGLPARHWLGQGIRTMVGVMEVEDWGMGGIHLAALTGQNALTPRAERQ